MDLLGPLAGGGTALVWRLHHALADGTTAMRLARTVLWDGRADGPPGARPAPPASRTQAADDARRRHHLAGFLEREFLPSPRRSPFDLPIGPDRGVAFAMTSLGRLRTSARALAGATVNDAVLAVMAGALRTWMVHRHGALHPVRVKVPVSLHNEHEPSGNRDSYFCVSLPAGRAGSGRPARLGPSARRPCASRATTRRRWPSCSTGWAGPRRGCSAGAPSYRPPPARSRSTSPTFPARSSRSACSVRDVEAIHSIAEVGERHALRAAVVSVADRLCFGLCADRGVIGDLDVLAGAIEHEALVMTEAAGAVADR